MNDFEEVLCKTDRPLISPKEMRVRGLKRFRRAHLGCTTSPRHGCNRANRDQQKVPNRLRPTPGRDHRDRRVVRERSHTDHRGETPDGQPYRHSEIYRGESPKEQTRATSSSLCEKPAWDSPSGKPHPTEPLDPIWCEPLGRRSASVASYDVDSERDG